MLHLDEYQDPLYKEYEKSIHISDRQSKALELIYIYYIYKMECRRFGADRTKIAPGLSHLYGRRIATFDEFLNYLVDPDEREKRYNPSGQTAASHLGLLPGVDWAVMNLLKDKNWIPKVDMSLVHEDLKKKQEEGRPDGFLTRSDIHTAIGGSLLGCLQHRKRERGVFDEYREDMSRALAALKQFNQLMKDDFATLEDIKAAMHLFPGGCKRPLFKIENGEVHIWPPGMYDADGNPDGYTDTKEVSRILGDLLNLESINYVFRSVGSMI